MYVVEAVGLAVTVLPVAEDKVAAGDQVQEDPPETVSVLVPPSQKSDDVDETNNVAAARTETETDEVAEHPFTSVPTTVNEVFAEIVAVGEFKVALETAVAGCQSQVKPDPPVDDKVKGAPGQTDVCDADAVIVKLGITVTTTGTRGVEQEPSVAWT